jgi:hypothetical protein
MRDQVGHERFMAGDYSEALLAYLKAAEMGMELGQANAAWALSHVRTAPPCVRRILSLQRGLVAGACLHPQ